MEGSKTFQAQALCVARAEGQQRAAIAASLVPPSAQATAEVFSATNKESGELCGAAALWFTPNRPFAEHATSIVHVLPPHRRQGLGRRLLHAAAGAAADNAVGQLRSCPLEESSPAFQFAIACGFDPGPATLTCEAPMESYARVTRPVYNRLCTAGKIPPGAQVIPLDQARPDDVCRVILENLGYPAQHLADRVRRAEYGFSQTISQVALLDQRVVGALLITYQKAVASVDATAVLPQYRHTWVNAALKHFAVEELIRRRVKRVRFSANSVEHRDTVKLIHRVKGTVLKAMRLPTLTLHHR